MDDRLKEHILANVGKIITFAHDDVLRAFQCSDFDKTVPGSLDVVSKVASQKCYEFCVVINTYRKSRTSNSYIPNGILGTNFSHLNKQKYCLCLL